LAQQQLKDQAKLGQEQRLAQADLAGAAEAAKRTAAASGLAGAKTRQTKELNAAQERQTAEVTSRFEQALRQAASESKITRNDVFQHIKQSTAELASMKNAAHLQDLVQKQALANKKYTAALQSVGQINRLDDAQQFELEAQKQIFGAEMMNLFRQQSHLFDFNANERKFAESMNSLDLQTKMDLMVAASKTEAITAGVEGAAKIGATAYKDKWFSDSDKPSTIPSQIEYDTYLSGGETQSHATQQQLSGTPAWYSNKSSIYGD
jgi:hypothetical protein